MRCKWRIKSRDRTGRNQRRE